MKSKFANGLLGFVLVLLFWQMGSMALQKPFLPAPAASFTAFFQMLLSGELGQHFIISTVRILCSIVLAMVLAVPVGLAMGRIAWLGRLLNPIVYLLYPLPKVVFLPIIVVLMGLGNWPKIFLIALVVFFSDCGGHPRRRQQYSPGQSAIYALLARHILANLSAFDFAQLSAADFDFSAHYIRHSHCHFIFCGNLCLFRWLGLFYFGRHGNQRLSGYVCRYHRFSLFGFGAVLVGGFVGTSVVPLAAEGTVAANEIVSEK